MPKPTPHWTQLQQRTEEEMGLLQWRYHMCMRDGKIKHTSHATMFSLVTSLHLGWPSKVQWYRKLMCRTIEEKSLMPQWWLWLAVLGYCNLGNHLLLNIRFNLQPPPPTTKESFLRLCIFSNIIIITVKDRSWKYVTDSPVKSLISLTTVVC